MRVAIVGGAGFVGANLACRLSGAGHRVVAADSLRRRGSEHSLPRLAAHGVRFEHADLRCPEDWGWLGEFDPEAVLDCAAQPSAVDGYRNPMADFRINTAPTWGLLDHCRSTGCALIFWSTNKVYGCRAVAEAAGDLIELPDRLQAERPIDEHCPLDGGDRSLYGCSKVAADLAVQEWADAFGFPGVVNRCSCLAGPWQWGRAEQGWVAWWVFAHRFGLPLRHEGHGGKQVRDVLHVDDLGDLVLAQLADLRPGPEVFNVGGGPTNTLSLLECGALCREVTGAVVVPEDAPGRRADFPWYVSDIAKAGERYGWGPALSPEEVVRDIDDWAAEHQGVLEGLLGSRARTEAA